MIINYRKPWNIEQNRLYELSDIMSGPSMQNDFTFYMRMKLLVIISLTRSDIQYIL